MHVKMTNKIAAKTTTFDTVFLLKHNNLGIIRKTKHLGKLTKTFQTDEAFPYSRFILVVAS